MESFMKKVGSYEAKTHLSSLLDQVANGESFTITKHGLPVAQLVPAPGAIRPDVESVIAEIHEFRSKHSLEGVAIKDLINEGRKY